MADNKKSVGVEMRQEHAEDYAMIDGYGDGGFRVKGRRFEGSIIITPEGVYPAAVDDSGEPTAEGLKQLSGKGHDLLLIGRGDSMIPLPKTMRLALEEQGLPYDLMDTGAAARTYNVLLIEGRRVSALLRAV